MLYVGNLPFSTTEQDVRELLGRFGPVVSAGVVTDRETGRNRGFAFAMMADGGEEAIYGLHGHEFQGRMLTVNVARGRWSILRRPPRETI